MPDLTKLAACSLEMVCAGAQAILLGMRLTFPWRRSADTEDSSEV
jgi:hypothetical protein